MTPSKSELRKYIRKLKSIHTSEESITESAAIWDRLLMLDEIKQARRILLYHSLPDEVYTHSIIDTLSQRADIYLPRIDGEDITIARYQPTNPLIVGSYGIMEPEDRTTTSIDINQMDIVIVPAMALDADGNRLGRGKGYYDKLLHNYTGYKIGVVYQFQLLEHIPSDEYDIPMNIVITNNHTYINGTNQ